MGRAWRFRISSFWPFTKVELKRRVKFADFIISARFLSRESWNTLSPISPTFFPTFHFEFFWSLSKGIELSISLENGNRNEREREREKENNSAPFHPNHRRSRFTAVAKKNRYYTIGAVFSVTPRSVIGDCPLPLQRDTSRNSILRVRKLGVLVAYHRRE